MHGNKSYVSDTSDSLQRKPMRALVYFYIRFMYSNYELLLATLGIKNNIGSNFSENIILELNNVYEHN